MVKFDTEVSCTLLVWNPTRWLRRTVCRMRTPSSRSSTPCRELQYLSGRCTGQLALVTQLRGPSSSHNQANLRSACLQVTVTHETSDFAPACRP